MTIILLSGGSGKRLWPLSGGNHSKQFLRVLQDNEGRYESMSERVLRQIKAALPDASVLVTGNQYQIDALRYHLGDIEIIEEPTQRDTFAAIVLSAAYLKYRKNMSDDHVFIASPIDVYAESGFFTTFIDLEALAAQNNIALLGAYPTHPSSKYGYILMENGEYAGFREKPSEKDAEALISSGAKWNCGVFGLSIGYVLSCARRYIDFNCYDDCVSQFEKLPKISFDCEIVEKEANIGVDIYPSFWKDLGTWNTLTEAMHSDTMGDMTIMGESCQNTHVLNMLNIPIIALGVKDSVIVAGYDGILVSKKSDSVVLKDYIDRINMRPMYDRCTWGQYRVLEYIKRDNAFLIVKLLNIDEGKCLARQCKSLTTWVVVNGKGFLSIEGVDSVVACGGVFSAVAGTSFRLLADTQMELIETQTGTGESEEA